MSKTTRDEINLDLDGTIDAAIKKLQKLKKQYPGGRINLTSDYEYGESYPRLRLEFTRKKEPIELEYDRWREKLSRFGALNTAARAYEAEGDKYPRAAELAALEAELGAWAKSSRMGSLAIYDGELLMSGFDGAYTRDGEYRWKTMMNFDVLKSLDMVASDSDTRPKDGDAKQGSTCE
jgi:hypothetical protein